ncbi:MAG TPA: RsmD family RNA methyltransferase, partial [Bacteroidota bacterium]|nr:RsmD family RNA methyltransferase [Bacteroidota bacterium]
AGALGCADHCEIITQDAAGFLSGINGIFQLIFVDPPYDYGRTGELPRLVFSSGILDAGGYLIVEHRRGTAFETACPPDAVFTRRFGNTEVTFFHHPPPTNQKERHRA